MKLIKLQRFSWRSVSSVTYLVQSSKATHSPCWKVSISSRFPHRVALSALLTLKKHRQWQMSITMLIQQYSPISENVKFICTEIVKKKKKLNARLLNHPINQRDFSGNPHCPLCLVPLSHLLVIALTCRWLAVVVGNNSALFVILWQTPAHVPRCPVPPAKAAQSAEYLISANDSMTAQYFL